MIPFIFTTTASSIMRKILQRTDEDMLINLSLALFSDQIQYQKQWRSLDNACQH
jgi:hypothetical protein